MYEPPNEKHIFKASSSNYLMPTHVHKYPNQLLYRISIKFYGISELANLCRSMRELFFSRLKFSRSKQKFEFNKISGEPLKVSECVKWKKDAIQFNKS